MREQWVMLARSKWKKKRGGVLRRVEGQRYADSCLLNALMEQQGCTPFLLDVHHCSCLACPVSPMLSVKVRCTLFKSMKMKKARIWELEG